MKDIVVKTDVDIAVRDYGARGSGGVPGERRPDVLLIHGGGRNVCDWDEVVRHLAKDPKGMRVAAMDLRGHGESSVVEEWDWDKAVDDVDAVASALSMQRPIVVGHSLGGMVASEFAARNDDCAGIINVDGSGQTLPSTWPGWDTDEALRKFAELKEKGAAEALDAPDGMTPEEAEDGLVKLREWAEKTGISAAMLEAGARRGATTGDDGRVRSNPTWKRMNAYMGPIGEMDIFEVYRRTKHPILHIVSTRDEPNEDASVGEWMSAHRDGMHLDYERLAGERSDFRMERMDGGHMLNLELPEQVAASIMRFVAEVAQ
jgi:pimeloyl-ACP methyl ester carboxylesterase